MRDMDITGASPSEGHEGDQGVPNTQGEVERAGSV